MQQLAGILKESIEIPNEWSELEIDSDPEWNDPEYEFWWPVRYPILSERDA